MKIATNVGLAIAVCVWTQAVAVSAASFEQSGVIGSYYADAGFTNLVAARVEPAVAFPGMQERLSGVPKKHFSVRWQGSVQAPVSGPVTFGIAAAAGDAVRFAVAIPEVTQPAGRRWLDVVSGTSRGVALTGSVDLVRGEIYAVQVEWQHAAGTAAFQLEWEYAGSAGSAVPAAALFPREPLSVSYLGRAWLPLHPGRVEPADAALTTQGPRLRLALEKGDAAGAAEQGVMAARELQGNGHATVRLADAPDARGAWQAGVLLREGDAAGARLVSLDYAGGEVRLQSRVQTNGEIQTVAKAPAALPVWLKLVRNGPTVCAYSSETGAETNWNFLGRADLRFLADRVLLGLAGVSSKAGGQAQFDNLDLAADVPVGGNLGGVATYGSFHPFKNILRGGFGRPSTLTEKGGVSNDPAKIGEDGWPTEDFGFGGMYIQKLENLGGRTLPLTFTGKAKIQKAFWGPETITAADAEKTKDAGFVDGYNAASNTSRYYIRLDGTKNGDQGASLVFRQTQRTASAPAGSGVSHLALLWPGYDQDDEQNVFTEEFLAMARRGEAFRFMDWGRINGSEVSHWSERTLPQAAGICVDAERCYEYMIQLCNQAGRDMWVNIPALADDDYVRHLADLIAHGSTINGVTYPGLRPDLNVYVEYSNETWNWGFKVQGQLSEKAWTAFQSQEKFGPAQALLSEGSARTNKGDTGFNYCWLGANMAGRIVPRFAEAFGAEAIGTRVRPVISGWTIAADGSFGAALDFIRRAGWDPRRIIYGAAVTGYFGYQDLLEAHAGRDERRASLTLENGLNAFETALDINDALMNDNVVAAQYGVKLMAYETGPSTGVTRELGLGERDPRFRGITVDGLNSWFAAGGALSQFFSFNYGNYGGAWGDWQISDNAWDQNQPRSQAISDVRWQPGAPPLVNGPIMVPPQVIDGRQVSGASNFADRRETAAATLRYSLRSYRDQVVVLRVNAHAGETGQVMTISLNGVQVEKFPLPELAAKPEDTVCQDLPPVKLMLHEGLNALQLQAPMSQYGKWLVVNCLKVSAADAVEPVPATLPWAKSRFETKINLTENSSWKGRFLFEDGVTLSNQWLGELVSDAPALIPNDARHLEVTRDDKTGNLQLAVTAASNQVGKAGVRLRVSNASGTVRDWHFVVSVTPAAPRDLTASALPDGAVELRWRNESARAGFADLERTASPADRKSWTLIHRMAYSGNPDSVFRDHPPSGKGWYYRVSSGKIISLPGGNTESISSAVALKNPVTPLQGDAEGLRVSNLLSGRPVFAKGLWKPKAEAVADARFMNDGDEASKVHFDSDGGAVAFTGLPGEAIRALAFWLPAIKDFSGKDCVDTGALPPTTVYASSEDYSTAGAGVALDPAHYSRVTEKPLVLADGKGWWDGGITAPVRVSPDWRDCWVSPVTGLNVPAGTKSLLLVFEPAKSHPNFAEIQAFSRYEEAPPATVEAHTAWRQQDPMSFPNPCGAVVELTWAPAPSGAFTHYAVQRATTDTFKKDVQTFLLPPCSSNFTNDRLSHDRGGLNPLPPGVDYYYRVGTRKPGGAMLWTNNTVHVRTAAPDATLATPSNLTARSDAGCRVNLEWTGVPGAIGYKLERADEDAFAGSRTGLILTPALQYVDRTTESGKTYFYRVRASFGDADSAWVTTMVTTPERSLPPLALQAVADVGSVRLHWNPAHGKLQGYEVFRGADGAHLEVIQPYRVGAAQIQFVDFTDRNVPPGHWCYAVRGVWFTAANPSEMKFTEFSPLAAVDVQ